MCDRIQCDQIATHYFIVEVTGEHVELCPQCIQEYDQGQEIIYAPKDGKKWVTWVNTVTS